MPETKTTEWYLLDIDRAVDALRTGESLRDQEIDEIREEIASFIGLCKKGLDVIAAAGIDLINPRIESLRKYPEMAGQRESQRTTIKP